MAKTLVQLNIPTIGAELTLVEPWTFRLYPERRNNKFANENFGLGFRAYSTRESQWYTDEAGRRLHRYVTKEPTPVTLAKGTVLKLDRMYIRKANTDFDSITFYCNVHITPKQAKVAGVPRGRFWAPLDDVNRILAEMVSP